MHHLILLLIKFVYAVFKEDMKQEQVKNFRSIHYDNNTKRSVLIDQLRLYLNAKTIEDKMQIEDYIMKVIPELKKDAGADNNKLLLLDDLIYELKFNTANRKTIERIMQKL
jgi:hypothetical protein